MADTSKAAPEPAAPSLAVTKEKNKSPVKMILLGLLLGGSIWFIYPSLLLGLGLIPTLVAIFTAKEPGRNSAVAAVGFMNAAAVSPFLIELWQRGQTLSNALSILTTPENWVIMFGGAAIGQLIFFAVPQAIVFASIANSEMRIKKLRANLEQIEKAWGPDVATTKPLDEIIPND